MTRPQPADWSSDLDQATVREKLRIERRCELKAELHEWFDSRRFGVEYLTELIVAHNKRIEKAVADEEDNGYDYVLPEDYHSVKRSLLLPFPRAEISVNYNISDEDQNYGY